MPEVSNSSLKDLPDRPRTREIKDTSVVSPTVRGFSLWDPASAEASPGQYAMIWVPGHGEIPLSYCWIEGDRIGFGVKKVGQVTEQLHRLREGDLVGIRGPYGTGFSRPNGSTWLIAGGCGVPPIRHYHQTYHDRGPLEVMIGAETGRELLYTQELQPGVVATDDGSKGYEGKITEPFAERLRKTPPNMVLAAGPEKMLHEIFRICIDAGVNLEVSLERYMKCGIGVCGSCLIDTFRVCRDGPVADLSTLQELEEFGETTRDGAGRKEQI